MPRFKQFLLALCFISALCFWTACEKEVHINLSNGATQLVVNGQIETSLPPYVVLTHSIGFFSKVDLKTLENSFIHDADVRVSDGSREFKLREYAFDSTSGNTTAHFFLYSTDVNDPKAADFLGVPGRIYRLTIISEGKTYTSYAKIPVPQPIDSMVAVAPDSPPSKAPTARQLLVYYSDPDTPGNAVRYFTRRNSEPFYPGPNSVFDDAVINGSKNGKYPILIGTSGPDLDLNDSSGFIFPGDTVTLKWAAIDRGVYNFYVAFEYAINTVGNPFSSPINVPSNVNNGALGVWAAYGATYTTIVVPK
jgi:hypothetical protein